MACSNPADSMKTCLVNIVPCQFYNDSSSRRNQPCMCVVCVVCVLCVCVCVCVCVVRCNSKPLHLQPVSRSVQTVKNKGRKEERYFNFNNLFILSKVFFVLCLLVTFKQFLV